MTTSHLRAAPALAALSALLMLGAPAQAQLVNGGFDAAGPSFAGAGSFCYLGLPGALDCGMVPGWSGTLQVIAATSDPWGTPASNGGWTAAQGSHIAGLQNTSFMQQTVTLAAGSYTLAWLDSHRNAAAYQDNSYKVMLDGATLGTWQTASGDGWASRSLSLNLAGGSHTLRFEGLRDTGDGTSFIDSVALAPVPEPQAAALLALGLAGLALVQRRRRVNAAD